MLNASSNLKEFVNTTTIIKANIWWFHLCDLLLVCVSFSVFFFVLVLSFLFEEHVPCVYLLLSMACVKELSTICIQTYEHSLISFERRNLKWCWRLWHIPFMEYFHAKKANKAAHINVYVGFVDLVSDYSVFSSSLFNLPTIIYCSSC